MGLFSFIRRLVTNEPVGIPAREAPDRLLVSVAMVNQLISIFKSRGFVGDGRVRMIGEHLWQLGGKGSLQVARDKIQHELGTEAEAQLQSAWHGVMEKPRDPDAAREIMLIEKAGLITDAIMRGRPAR